MGIVYREEKGAALTSDEVDNNFREVEARLKALEKYSEPAESLEQITFEGNDLIFKGTFGKIFGTIPIPKSTLTPRGEWGPEQTYHPLDLVTYAGALYCCSELHKSTNWDHEAFYWKLMFSCPEIPKRDLPLFEKDTLPKESTLGTLAVLIENKNPRLIFFNGDSWQPLNVGEKL